MVDGSDSSEESRDADGRRKMADGARRTGLSGMPTAFLGIGAAVVCSTEASQGRRGRACLMCDVCHFSSHLKRVMEMREEGGREISQRGRFQEQSLGAGWMD